MWNRWIPAKFVCMADKIGVWKTDIRVLDCSTNMLNPDHE